MPDPDTPVRVSRFAATARPPAPLTDAMLAAAVRKAIEGGLLAEFDSPANVAQNWGRIRDVVRAALDAKEG